MEHKEKPNAVAHAVDKAGSQERLADQLGVSQQAISKWLRRGYVPLQRAQEIEIQYGIPRARLINPRIVDLADIGGDDV